MRLGRLLQRDHDAGLDPFDRGLATLHRDGVLVGHVATVLTSFWSPGRPLTIQDQVWLTVVWCDGERERPVEDYPPWTGVTEVLSGTLVWEEGRHRGVYAVEWVPAVERRALWDALGLRPSEVF